MRLDVDVFFATFGAIALYYLVMFVWSFKKVEAPEPDLQSLGFVILVPALNEEAVIDDTCKQMKQLQGNVHVIVIDDGSDDLTPDIVRKHEGTRIHLFQRKPPEARQGKGMALNAAYQFAQKHFRDWFGEYSDMQIVIGVTDADVFIAQQVIDEVAATFQSSTDVGAVQAPVSIRGANENLWLLMQDIEFQAFFHFVQKARHWISSVAMGGNGQFTRFSAMKQLGDRPWSRALTEDIDLGMALTGAGQRICFTGKTPVMQHGLTSLRRLLKQRSRWVQGHYQVWRRIVPLWRSHSRIVTKLDSTLYLAMIVLPLFLAADYIFGILSMVGVVHPYSNFMNALGRFPYWVSPVVQLILAFSIQLIFLPSYSRVSRIRIPLYAWPGLMFTFAIYTAFLWICASMIAFYRMIRGQWGWIKTERESVSAKMNVS